MAAQLMDKFGHAVSRGPPARVDKAAGLSGQEYRTALLWAVDLTERDLANLVDELPDGDLA